MPRKQLHANFLIPGLEEFRHELFKLSMFCRGKYTMPSINWNSDQAADSLAAGACSLPALMPRSASPVWHSQEMTKIQVGAE